MISSTSLSTSPVSSMALPEAFATEDISLEEFLCLIPSVIQETKHKNDLAKDPGRTTESSSDNNPIANLLGRVVLEQADWDQFAHFDKSKNYTRNLVATDGQNFTLVLLCWNPGRESPIHDHPCDGCWMRVVQGSVYEKRYSKDIDDDSDSLQCIHDEIYKEGQLAYITDSMGYHKVGNPSETVPAITLHLYCPPFQRCRIWLNQDHASKPSASCVSYHSEYGRLT